MKNNLKHLTLICFVFIAIALNAQTIDDNLFGITIDDPWADDLVEAVSGFSYKPTARIVFDEWVAANEYVTPISELSSSCLIMGELLDSYYVNEYSVTQYLNRTTEYLDAFEDDVDVWEIGNEVNGDWVSVDKNPDSISVVIQKIEGAYDIVEARGKKTALTLYFNRACYYDKPEFEMFTWVNDNLPNKMKEGLDFVIVSYYEDDCESTILSESDWQEVFDSLHVIFPNSKLGIGECGTQYKTTNIRNSRPDNTKEKEFINRYYTMDINTPNYIGGYFWWYFSDDCVPKTKELWSTLNDINVIFRKNNDDYILTTEATNGSVTKSPNKSTYIDGEKVTLTATPNSGYQFDNWSDEASGTITTVEVIMNSNKTVTANFSEIAITNIKQQLVLSRISVFPNPSSGKLTLSFNSNYMGKVFVQVINLDGQVVSSEMLLKKEESLISDFRISNQKSGIYFIKVIAGEYLSQQKIILK